MGLYINQNSNGTNLPACNKADYLLLDGGKEIFPPIKFQPNLVCVVENGLFDAAGFCYNENEFKAFNDPSDPRPKRWIIYPNAAKISGYKK